MEKLKEAISLLQEKRKKMIFCCETDRISFTTQEAITCSKSGKKTLKQCQKPRKKINFKLCVLYRIS